MESSLMLDETTTLASLSSIVEIGGEQYGGWFDGMLDEVTLWNRSLSEAEVQEIVGRQSPPYTGELQSLVCDDGSSERPWTHVQVTTSESAGPRVAPAELLGFWPLNGLVGPVNEGIAVEDVSGNGLAGAYLNLDGAGMGFEPGTVAESVRFDGLDDYIAIDPPPVPSGTGEISVATWVRIAELSATGHPILDWGGLQIGTSSTGQIEFSVGAESLQSTASVADGAWHHVAGTYAEGRFVRLYVDGNVETAITQSMTPGWDATPPLLLATDGARFLSGALDEASVWSRALSPGDVQGLYFAGAHRVLLQIRGCDDPACTGRPFLGPDGGEDSFFAPPSYVFDEGPNTFALEDVQGRYIQWRAVLQSERTVSGPVLANVTFLR
jgi:hypothetical protein